MRTNRNNVTEVAHVRSYGSPDYHEGWDRIFGKKNKESGQEEVKEEDKDSNSDLETIAKFKEAAKNFTLSALEVLASDSEFVKLEALDEISRIVKVVNEKLLRNINE